MDAEEYIPEHAIIAPQLPPVPKEDAEALTNFKAVHPDLLAFWQADGAGSFIRDRGGNRVNDMASNRLLDAEEVLELVQGDTYDVADLMKFGTPFFNKLDREFIAIADNGEIVDTTAMGERRLVAASLREFVDRLLVNPLFYEEHLSGTDDLNPDDVFGTKK